MRPKVPAPPELLPAVPQCRRCGTKRTPQEVMTYGTFCEDCYAQAMAALQGREILPPKKRRNN